MGFFNCLESREREEPKMTGPSNLDHRRKVISIKETGKPGKEGKKLMSPSFGTYSVEVLMG